MIQCSVFSVQCSVFSKCYYGATLRFLLGDFALKFSNYFHPNLSSRPKEGTRTIHFQCLLQPTTDNRQPTTFPKLVIPTKGGNSPNPLPVSTSTDNRQPTTDNRQLSPNLSSRPKEGTRTIQIQCLLQPTTDNRQLSPNLSSRPKEGTRANHFQNPLPESTST